MPNLYTVDVVIDVTEDMWTHPDDSGMRSISFFEVPADSPQEAARKAEQKARDDGLLVVGHDRVTQTRPAV